METRRLNGDDRLMLARLIYERWDRMEGQPIDAFDALIRAHLLGLFVWLYVYAGSGRTIRSVDAYTCMHCSASKAQALLDDAVAAGFITLQAAPQGVVGTIIQPTDKLIAYVDAEITRDFGEICSALRLDLPPRVED